MSNQPLDHPLTTQRHLAALAVAALFWGVGLTMLDSHVELGVFLCVFGLAATIWLYFNDMLKMRSGNLSKWPWVGLTLIFIEIAVSGRVLLARADELKAPVAGAVNSDQRGGQTAEKIYNNGPVYNAPAPAMTAPASKTAEETAPPYAPVTQPEAAACPPGTAICAHGGDNNTFTNNHISGMKNCIVLDKESNDSATENKCD